MVYLQQAGSGAQYIPGRRSHAVGVLPEYRGEGVGVPIPESSSRIPDGVSQQYGVATFRYIRPSGTVGRSYRTPRPEVFGNPYFAQTQPPTPVPDCNPNRYARTPYPDPAPPNTSKRSWLEEKGLAQMTIEASAINGVDSFTPWRREVEGGEEEEGAESYQGEEEHGGSWGRNRPRPWRHGVREAVPLAEGCVGVQGRYPGAHDAASPTAKQGRAALKSEVAGVNTSVQGLSDAIMTRHERLNHMFAAHVSGR